jgi:hypothetical protein
VNYIKAFFGIVKKESSQMLSTALCKDFALELNGQE